MSKRNKSKRATEQGAERVQRNEQKEYETTMSAHDREKQAEHQNNLTLGGE